MELQRVRHSGGTNKQEVLGASLLAQRVKNLPAMQETQETRVQTLGREDPLEEEMATIPVFLPEKSHGQRCLVGYSLMSHKELDTTE